jgi:hypothetical protein
VVGGLVFLLENGKGPQGSGKAKEKGG